MPVNNTLLLHFYADVDECLTGNGGCEQICNNTEGSFECLCNEGYVLTANNFDCNGNCTTLKITLWKFCIDVDECQTSNGGCAEFCNNTDGSFECSCRTGYMLAADNANCEGKVNGTHPKIICIS